MKLDENEKGSPYDCSFKLLNYHIKVNINFGRINHRTYDLSLPGRRQKPQTTEGENDILFTVIAKTQRSSCKKVSN